MFMSGSRGPVFMFVLLFPLYWWLALAREKRGGSTFGRMVVGSCLLAIFLFWVGEDAVGAFFGRARGATDVQARLASPLLSPYLLLPEAGLFGFGIGATHQSAATLAPHVPPYSWMRGLAVEAETGRILLELGPLGFLLVSFVRIYLPLLAFLQALRLRTRYHRSLAVAAFLFILAQLPGGSVFDVTAGVYYWLFVGLLTTAMRLDRQLVAATARTAPQPPVVPIPAVPQRAWPR
jgi:hypothetical protein